MPLYVNVRELTTSLMPHAGGLGVEGVLDLTDHQLLVQTMNGSVRRMVLEPRSVADFHGEFTPHLRDLGVDAPIHGTPVEVTEAVPLAEDHEHASYDADAVHRFLDLAGERPPGAERVSRPVPWQGQPGALLLGRLRPRHHPLLRPCRGPAPRWRAQLPGLGHDRGLQRGGLRAAGTGRGAPRASSAPTPTPSPPDTDSTPSCRPRWRTTTPSTGSSSPTPTSAPRRIPTSTCSSGVHLHTLRHSAASFLLAAGTHTEVVQEHLGHWFYAITADIYSHVGPGQQREAADRLDEALRW